MEDLLLTLGVVKQTEQHSTNEILRDKIHQSITFPNFDKPLNITDLVQNVHIEGLPKLSLGSLRSLRRDLSSKHVDKNSLHDLIYHTTQMKFLDSLMSQEGVQSSKTNTNKATLQSILSDSALTSHKSISTSCASLMDARREAKLISTEELVLNNKLYGQSEVRRSYKRGFGNNNHLSLNIHSSLSDTSAELTHRDAVNEGEMQALIQEAKSQHKRVTTDNPSSSSGNDVKVAQRLTDLEPEEFRPQFANPTVKRASKSPKTTTPQKAHASTPSISRRKPVSTHVVSKDVICPICSRVIEVGRKESAAVALDRHVDRCTRRGTRGAKTTSYGEEVIDEVEMTEAQEVGEYLEGGDEAWSEEEEEKETGSARKRPRRGSNKAVVVDVDSDNDEKDSGRPSPVQKLVSKTRLKRNSFSSGKSSNRKSPSRPTAASRNLSSESEYELDADEEEEEQRLEEEEDAVDESDILVENTTLYAQDDWEDDAYLERTQSMAPEDLATVETTYGTAMNSNSYNKLYEYQREGVQWMFDLYQEGVGGILGDEMGLGKTAQLCTHFDSLSNLQQTTNRANNTRRNNSAVFLVVCPATVLQHWLSEFHAWAPHMRAVILHAISSTGHELMRLGDEGIELVLKKLKTNKYTQGLTVITTYEGMRKHKAALTVIEWTAVCLDEGQKIRNPAADITICCKTLPAFHRVILSGTPIQNNLQELWSLFDFIYPGRIGVLSVFDNEFATPIRVGGYINATKLEYEVAIQCAATLQRIIKPYLLRRKKEDLAAITRLPAKTEQVLFCQISPVQRDIYLNILGSSEVQAVLERKAVAFRAINTLRKLCNHPALMFHHGQVQWHSERSKAGRRLAEGDEGDEAGSDEDDALNPNKGGGKKKGSGVGGSAKINWGDSGKLLVLSKVLPLWHSEGHKVLIFTQTRSMLSIIEAMVQELNFKYRRLDGSTPIQQRAGLIDTYNNNPSVFLMLLTTRTGGVGISLTSANRVVVFDPDWNPMTDIQSRERAWRLGQQREVTIYRLITRGTIEEKIYQRQIFKLLLSSRILDNPKQKALFSKSDIRELFQLDEGAGGIISGGDRGYSASRSGRMYEESGHNLPLGGEVDLRKQKASAIDIADSSLNSTQTVSLLEEGEVTDSRTEDGSQLKEDNSGVNTNRIVLDVETYVHQPLPAKLLSELSQIANSDNADAELPSITSASSSSGGANSGGYHDRDRRLLQALFEGEAITSVYDHDYLQAENSVTSKEVVRTRQTADRVVDRAVQALSSSKTLYTGATSSSENTSSSSNAVNNRFGGRSASGNPALSSSALLTTLRANHSVDTSPSSDGGNVKSGGVRFSDTDSTSNSSDPVVTAQSSSSSSSSSSSAIASPRLSVQQDILNRLNTMFSAVDSSGGGGNRGSGLVPSNGMGRGPVVVTRYTTNAVLMRFKDFGDQYAPLFKDCLRSVAELKEGYWVKKK